MLELASQRGFHECAQHYVSTPPGIPGNGEGAGFSIPLGRNAALSERSELAPERESVPTSGAQGNRAPQGFGRPAQRRIPTAGPIRRCCCKPATH